jgi:hypothetical protein
MAVFFPQLWNQPEIQTTLKYVRKGGFGQDMFDWMQQRFDRVQNIIDEYNERGFYSAETMNEIKAPLSESKKWQAEVSRTLIVENIGEISARERKQRQLTINKRNRLREELQN